MIKFIQQAYIDPYVGLYSRLGIIPLAKQGERHG